MGRTIEEQRNAIREKNRKESALSTVSAFKKKTDYTKMSKNEKKKYLLSDKYKDKQRKCAAYCLELKKKATSYEKLFKSKLSVNKIRHIFQKGFIKGNMFCIADFYLPDIRTVIEIDGEYHDSDNQKKRDKAKDEYYTKERHFKVIRIKNTDVEYFDVSVLKPK